MNKEASDSENAAELEAVKKQAIEQHEVPEVLDFLKENGIAIVVGVLVAVVAFVGYTVFKNSRAAKIDAASTLLANSQSVPQFQEVIANYADTPSAPLAQLSLASAYYDQSQFELARDTFTQFGEKFPNHPMAQVAELGVAQSLEALERYDDAISAYDAFLSKNAGHFMVPTAVFGKARVLESQQKFAEAKSVYELFIAENPESEWLNRAETGLDFVKKQERAAAVPAAAPAIQVPAED
jgi:predicted negative regulator of RcsB-dependent stress response